jgi:hypothetical protein
MNRAGLVGHMRSKRIGRSGLMTFGKVVIVGMVCSLVSCSLFRDSIVFPTGKELVEAWPYSQTKYFGFSGQVVAKIGVVIEEQPKIDFPVDVLLVFDRTGSMDKMIQAAAKSALGIVGDLQAQATDIRFGVASFADYQPLFSTHPSDSPWTQEAGFSTDPIAIQQAIAGIDKGNGGDGPESYSRALYEAQFVSWRDGARKLIVLFGDSVDHEVDPGRDGLLGTTDDLRMPPVVQQLTANKIQVVGIFARSLPAVSEMFRAISKGTGGKALPLESASETSSLLKAAILDSLRPVVNISAHGPLQGWVKSVTPYVNESKESSYSVEIEPADDAPPGLYRIPLSVSVSSKAQDQPFVGSAEAVVVVGWFNHPFVPFAPLLTLLSFLAYLFVRSRFGRFNSNHHLSSSGPPDESHYGARWLLGDVIAFACVGFALIGIGVSLNDNIVLSDLPSLLSGLANSIFSRVY